MLLSFAIENYRSFRDVAILDLQKRSFTTNLPKDKNWVSSTQRVAAIFGANAAGKSNILRPLDLLASAVAGSVTEHGWLRTLRDPHRTRTEAPTRLQVEYEVSGIRFRWGLELSDEGIVSERLDANPAGYWRKVFSRKSDQIEFGPKSTIPKSVQENISEFLKPWVLSMSAWSLMKRKGEYAGAVSWWSSSIATVFPGETEQSRRHESLLKMVAKHPSWLLAAQLVMHVADVGIAEVRIKERDVPDELKEFASRMNEVLAEGFVDSENISDLAIDEMQEVLQYLEFSHTSEYGDFNLDEREESLGTRSWFDLAIPAIYTLVTGGVLIVDEIDSSLHPVLLRHLVGMFTDESINVGAGQILFTSHDLTLMGHHPEPAIDSEAAWLVEKSGGCSELIAWDEFPIRAPHNLEKRYFQGRYGAIPMPDLLSVRPAIKKLRSEYLSFKPRRGEV